MKRFKLVDVFDRRTGQKLPQGELQVSGYWCDYCGAFKEGSYIEDNYVSFTINEEGGSEESWYEKNFDSNYVNADQRFDFWTKQEKYHYCVNEDYDEFCSCKMISETFAINPLHEVMQSSRVSVVNRLLADGVNATELGFGE